MKGTLYSRLLPRFTRVADVRNSIGNHAWLTTEQRYISDKRVNAIAKTYIEERMNNYRERTHLLLSWRDAVEERISINYPFSGDASLMYMFKVNNETVSNITVTSKNEDVVMDISKLQTADVARYIERLAKMVEMAVRSH